jgi:CRP-like cAMP-binding protein
MTHASKTLLHKTIVQLTKISTLNLDELFKIAVVRELKKGDLILQQGQICKTILFVEKGYLRTYIDKDGTEINTDFTFEGNFTTDLKSLRLATSAEKSIQAGENTIVYQFDKNKLLELYLVSAEIESFGRKLLEQLLIAQEEHSNLFKLFSPTERYHYLQIHKPELLQRISLSQLSSYLGIARETLSRIRKK